MMLKVARILIIISMIFGFILIFPIFVGKYALDKLDNARSHDDLKKPAIIVLLFSNFLAGLLLLLSNQQDLNEYQKYRSNGNVSIIINGNESGNTDINVITYLLKLKELYDNQIIDEQTYLDKRNKYKGSIIDE